jgi:hypothetical protein
MLYLVCENSNSQCYTENKQDILFDFLSSKNQA